MALIDDAKEQLGDLFITGFTGLELSDDTSAFLSQARIGGVILFAPNYENPGQVAELANQIQECRRDLPLWVTVDQEGGKVQRFKKPFTRIPDAATVAASGSPRVAFDLAELVAKELKAVGVNVNFAPVADIQTNPRNPVIGSRAYGSTEDEVTKLVTAVVRGHLLQGVQACVKHFPGHGDTAVDSHFALPKVDTDLATLREREFRPFIKAFKSRCSMVMIAHILNPKIDPKLPASLSPTFVREILRKELRYTKLILTDDMEMKAITDHFGADDAPRIALEAGCDLLIYRTEAASRHAYAALTKALEDGKLEPSLVLEAAQRSKALKKEVLGKYEPVTVSELPKKVGTAENLAFVQKLEEAAAKKA